MRHPRADDILLDGQLFILEEREKLRKERAISEEIKMTDTNELIAKLQKGEGSAELSAKVCQVIGIDRAAWEIADGSARAYDVTRSLDATEPLMRKRFRLHTITETDYYQGVKVNCKIRDSHAVHSGWVKGPNAHACAHCIVLLRAHAIS